MRSSDRCEADKRNLMQVKLFTIPALGDSAELEEMNKFLRSKRVLALESHFVLLI
jgi:hypothetical protein